MNKKTQFKTITYVSGSKSVNIKVSTRGDIYYMNDRKLQPSYMPYAYVSAYDPDSKSTIRVSVSRAVMQAFRPHPDAANLQVDHIDNNPRRNCVSNLQWVSRTRNNSRKHTRQLKSLHHKCTAHPGTVVQAIKGNEVIEAPNCKQLSYILGCSSTILYRILNPFDYAQTVHGYTIQRISKV